jgi:FOG: TPR repeat
MTMITNSSSVPHPRYVAAWVSLGRALLDLQQLDQAREAFRRALDLDPHNPVAWRLSGEALLALGMRREALGAFEQALALVPGDEVLSEAVATLREELAAVEQHPKLAPAPAPDAFGQAAEEEPFATLPPPPVVEEVFPWGSSRVDLQACKLGTGRRFTTS